MTFFGLSEREAEASRKKYGLNELAYKPSLGGNFLRGIGGLSCKLFAAAALAEIIRILLGLIGVLSSAADWARPAALLAAGLICGLAEALLRYRSELTLNGLCGYDGEQLCTVFRSGGKTEQIPRKMLTVGDAVFLSEGDLIPADGIMADGSLTADQSVFGVIGAAEKTVPPDGYRKGSIAGMNDPYAVYGGTTVCGGSGTVKITAIGENTEFARKNGVRAVELRNGVHGNKFENILRTGGVVGCTAALAVLAFGTVTGALSGQLPDGFLRGLSMSAAALAVACFCGKNLICESMAASAAKRLRKKDVRLSDVNVLNECSDIGLIVADRAGMIAEPEYSPDGTVFIDGGGKEYGSFGALGAGLAEILKNAVACTSSAVWANGKAMGGSPLDRALFGFLGRKAENAAVFKKQTEVRADSGSVLSGATVSAGGKLFTFVRGGAEILLERCSDSIGADGKKQKITNKSALQKLASTISLTGKDVIALAVSERGIKDGRLPSGGYALIGLAALYDSFYGNAAEEVKRLEKMGVKVILATEESRGSALFAAKYAGISGAKGSSKKSAGVVLDSEQLSKMSDRELAGRLGDIKAAVRAVPSDRRRLVRAAHENGIKVCASAAGLKSLKAVSEADLTVASPGCPSAVRAGSGAAAEKCGIKAIADIISCSVKYAAQCKGLIALRMLCTVAAAAAMLLWM
ncbi:MAG: hypothetical protein NC395_03950 [Prevotella sp.]|nr:hypothetical protein [Prevotella sp.]